MCPGPDAMERKAHNCLWRVSWGFDWFFSALLSIFIYLYFDMRHYQHQRQFQKFSTITFFFFVLAKMPNALRSHIVIFVVLAACHAILFVRYLYGMLIMQKHRHRHTNKYSIWYIHGMPQARKCQSHHMMNWIILLL